MSFWWHKRDKAGRRHLWQIDYDPMIIMLVIGMLAALIAPTLFRNPSIIIFSPFVFLSIGLFCLIISKISLYRKGIWFSFGPGVMSKGYAKLYKVGYLLLGVGALLLLALFNAMTRT
jgi:hypothetical protein